MNLNKLQAYCDKATEGPWYIGDKMWDSGVCCRIKPEVCTPGYDGKIEALLFNANYHLENRENDNDFVANARTDLPLLIKYARGLKKDLEHQSKVGSQQFEAQRAEIEELVMKIAEMMDTDIEKTLQLTAKDRRIKELEADRDRLRKLL